MITTEPKERVIELPCCCKPKPKKTTSQNEKKPKTFVQMAWRFAVGFILMGQMMVFGLAINITPPTYGSTPFWVIHGGLILSTLLVVLLLGGSLFRETFRMFMEKRLSIEGLFTLSAVGAFAGSLVCTLTGKGAVYYEVVAIVLFIYMVGKMLGNRSREKLFEEVDKLRASFDYIYIQTTDTTGRTQIPLTKLTLEDRVVVAPGEAVCVDGIIVSGEGFVKETAFTGEIEPVSKKVGDEVFSGTYSVDGSFIIRPKTLDRKIDLLLSMIEEARQTPSALMEQANRLVKYFLPIVVLISLATFIGWTIYDSWMPALINSMSVLLVACPCALGLATPLAIWSGLWKLAQLGLVSKTGQLIDALAKVTHVVLDKTGTLTEDDLCVSDFIALGEYTNIPNQVKAIVRAVESPIGHPVARALAVLPQESTGESLSVVSSRIIAGKGIKAIVVNTDNKTQEMEVLIGEKQLMPLNIADAFKAPFSDSKKEIYVAINNQPAAIIRLDEAFRETTQDALLELQKMSLAVSILTGDTHKKYNDVHGAKILYGISPQEKDEYIKDIQGKGDKVLFVGDGINDAIAMSESSASIAMGGASELVKSTAMGTLLNSNLSLLPKAIALCQRVHRSVRGSVLYAAGYNIIGMSFAAAGKLHPVIAVLIMLVSSAFVTSRAFRAVRER
ncbi:MAG: cation-transporting P-type ATPase [Verrucomicrobia bacterium CG_4_10_14_3_um_filter_43_23]|nr:MAG: ATPase P [Verrucomicrobia bacterium CG22_combo_CG10-13_8_21_14_all_43_17]PIX58210.1 MAG: cation-transporting P-type ATPase [Verrucomicrobia bacterium CG_4_10_14_3_um_filter_43_23]PIY61545.1 MAG: cation-transporting P-type ATPase [Verrucomicrobia bacterium CG_4_10_14_0_8_um_filter_43_34]PJA44387.1 MAG: cation-transporting P-type ATPase [Verrucomicrobia bacterium CG_4_9_14_3_um_filter_43_20]